MGELITGLDIGGAHLKAAQVGEDGRVLAAVQVPCPLWQGLDRLELALGEATARLAPVGRAATTMTGELADLFPDRATGVRRLVEAAAAGLPHARLRIWAGARGFVDPGEADARAAEIASANWLASATVVARRAGEALFVDLGSTTTDILLLAAGEVRAQGTSDRERLATGELVYTGLTRTPLMAVATRVPFAGRWVEVMNEHFATMADAYRVLGSLAETVDQHPAADGGEKTVEASARRLARMIGADLGEGTPEAWRQVAAWFARCQRRRIEEAVALQLSRRVIADEAPLVGAGCGRFLLKALARDLDRPYRDFVELIDAGSIPGEWAATCAPAVAVALLDLEDQRARG
jgi:probable H4MPT-linked C1 transfer pathway protein